MGIVIAVVCLEAALHLALWGALYYRVNGLPLGVWKIAQRSRATDETRALDALQAAAASRIGGLVVGIHTYHEQLGGLVQTQIAEAEMRARISERRSSEAGVALSAASELVRQLRELVDGVEARKPIETGRS